MPVTDKIPLEVVLTIDSISPEVISKFKQNFSSDQKNLLAQNVCVKQDLWDVCRKQSVVAQSRHVFNTKLQHSWDMLCMIFLNHRYEDPNVFESLRIWNTT
ncbi:hypothetical protein KUTeg_010319 [Tegillarca granosa]|uniref:Uncharacterized protein n=1 Tax=Tegillarca granosa TaxID=220873 RepID=A0ABQ9F8L0_TEGGR|nr:hypothetical protein KUTeg_010319 [Tegillarca granosa]